MSYRELRNFCEMMRSLGYTRVISMENFRNPNFELVADALYWLVQRYDPDADIDDNISEEKDRVDFIRNVAKFFLSKARIRVNMRKLYQANGLAVQELLKIAQLLYKAQNTTNQAEDDMSMELGLSSKIQNLTSAKGLATQITDTGVKLFDLLGKEKELREARERSLGFLDNISRNLDSNAEQEYIRRCIRDIISNQTGSLEQMENMLRELEQDEQNLEAKIKKRSVELERAEKRIKSLSSVRPAYMDEYERLEAEMEQLFEAYVLKFRNLSYLEHDLEEFSKKEEAKMVEVNKQLQAERENIQNEELRILRGEDELGDSRDRVGRPQGAGRGGRQMVDSDDELSDNLIDDDEESGSMEDDIQDIDSDSTDNDF